MEPSPFQQGIQSMHDFQSGAPVADDLPYDVEEVFADIQIDPSHDVYDPTDAYVPRQRRQGNTGPKGVLADYAEAKERLRVQREYEENLSREKLSEQSMRVRTVLQDERAEKLEAEEELLNELDSDDAFMMQYKAKRAAEIQETLHKSQKSTFGYLRSVNADQYLEAIDGPHGAFVVLHLDQSYLPGCKQVNEVFSLLAQKHNTTLFVRMNSDQGGDYPDESLPGLLVYQHGQLVHNFIPLHQFLDRPFKLNDVENFLVLKDVLAK